MAAPVVAQERPVAGRIKVSTGSAFIVRDGALIPAQLGQNVFEADGLRTGADGKDRRHVEGRHARLARARTAKLQLDRFTSAPGRQLSVWCSSS